MPSLIPGYEYDIFISYRQKDNKYDGWVTEFVDNLKKELEATFKEDISVYFDINPHDGLLETHDVDASLKNKLKCLVFIPIISRTYCDPKSFAWEHEYKAFIELASQDQFGLKVKLPSGNVANRVLPIRIYDLNNTDIKLCETVLGGVLRGIEFVYAEPGVNRPLKPDDDEKINLNNTKYRNQINKVGNAIQEIILGLSAEPINLVKEKTLHSESLKEDKTGERKKEQEKSARKLKRRIFSEITILAILIFATVIAYPILFKRDALKRLQSSGEKISIAVMPFQNLTNDTIWNVWQVGVQDMLITSLSNSSEGLTIRQAESINNLIQNKGLTNYASITPVLASTISQKLEANVFIYGNIKKAGSTIRVDAQLIDTKTEEVFKAFQIESVAREVKIFQIIDSLSTMVKDFLLITKLEKKVTYSIAQLASVNYPEAFRYLISGQNAFNNRDWAAALKFYSQAIDIDSNLFFAYTMLSATYLNLGLFQEARKSCLDIYRKKDQMPLLQKLMTNWIYAQNFETPQEQIKYIKQLLEIDDQSPDYHFLLGISYLDLYQYDKGIPEYEKALEIHHKWGSKPSYTGNYSHLGLAYHVTGQYKKEKRLYKKAEIDFPNNSSIIYRQAVFSLTEGKKKDAYEYIEKFVSLRRYNLASEAEISTNLAGIYNEAGILGRAEEYYRQASSLDQENPGIISNLAWFLIDRNRNLQEGLDLIQKALELSPDDFNYLDTKGWGLYKQGKYKEALEILQRSYDLRRQKAIYYHPAYLHLEAAKKAVAGMK